MKIIKQEIITNIIEEELPFDINTLKENLNNCDWFDPNDLNDWDWFVHDWCKDWCNTEFSEEELEEHKNEIIEIMQERRKEEIQDEMNYYLDNVLKSLIDYNNNYKITEEEIHNYITKWFEENVD